MIFDGSYVTMYLCKYESLMNAYGCPASPHVSLYLGCIYGGM